MHINVVSGDTVFILYWHTCVYLHIFMLNKFCLSPESWGNVHITHLYISLPSISQGSERLQELMRTCYQVGPSKQNSVKLKNKIQSDIYIKCIKRHRWQTSSHYIPALIQWCLIFNDPSYRPLETSDIYYFYSTYATQAICIFKSIFDHKVKRISQAIISFPSPPIFRNHDD